MELIVRRGGEVETVRIERLGDAFEVQVGDKVFLVDAVATTGGVRSLLIEGRQYEVAVRSDGNGRYQVSGRGGVEEVEVLDPLAYLAEASHEEAGGRRAHRVNAYLPGRGVSVMGEEGAEVKAGQGLVILEAMKMENEIQAEGDGVVTRVFVAPGEAVEGGDPLFEIE